MIADCACPSCVGPLASKVNQLRIHRVAPAKDETNRACLGYVAPSTDEPIARVRRVRERGPGDACPHCIACRPQRITLFAVVSPYVAPLAFRRQRPCYQFFDDSHENGSFAQADEVPILVDRRVRDSLFEDLAAVRARWKADLND